MIVILLGAADDQVNGKPQAFQFDRPGHPGYPRSKSYAMLPICPKCDIKMIVLSMHGVEVEVCNKCRGVWLDAGELEEIVRQTGAKPDDALIRILENTGTDTKAKKYMCPRCDTPMRQLSIACTDKSELEIERCVHKHGLWFDEHELQRLLTIFPEECGTVATIGFLNDFFGIKTTNGADLQT